MNNLYTHNKRNNKCNNIGLRLSIESQIFFSTVLHLKSVSDSGYYYFNFLWLILTQLMNQFIFFYQVFHSNLLHSYYTPTNLSNKKIQSFFFVYICLHDSLVHNFFLFSIGRYFWIDDIISYVFLRVWVNIFIYVFLWWVDMCICEIQNHDNVQSLIVFCDVLSLKESWNFFLSYLMRIHHSF